MKFLWLYLTAPSKSEALKIAKILVEERLIACANIIEGVTSVYIWDGKLQEEGENLLIAKTQEHLFDKIQKRIQEIHPYSCPCLLSLPIEKGLEKYLHWIKEQTSS